MTVATCSMKLFKLKHKKRIQRLYTDIEENNSVRVLDIILDSNSVGVPEILL